MFRLALNSLCLLLCGTALAEPANREAPNPTAVPANQLVVAGNACGPAALLNAFRFGNPDWQRAANALPGDTDKQRITAIIRDYGMRPSTHLTDRPRWSRKGVNLADLADIANEMTRGHFLPVISQEVLFAKPGESGENLLQRVHQYFETSLTKGLPPVISLRRYIHRAAQWQVLDAHFVTLTAIPRHLEKGAVSFPVTYLDPWGGKVDHGTIAIPIHPILADTPAASPCLEAVFPQSSVGKKLAHPGESGGLTVAAVLGRW